MKTHLVLYAAVLGLSACATSAPPDPSPARLAKENASCRDLADGLMVKPKRVCATNTAWADYDSLKAKVEARAENAPARSLYYEAHVFNEQLSATALIASNTSSPQTPR